MRKMNGAINPTNQSDQRGNFDEQTFKEASDKSKQQYRSNNNVERIHKYGIAVKDKGKGGTMKNPPRRNRESPTKTCIFVV